MAESDRKSVKRVVLMELEVAGGELVSALEERDREALLTQLGVTDQIDGDVKILVQVAEAEGGPKQVVDEIAKVGGRFRAVARESFDQGSETVPPEQQQFELKPL